MENNNINNPKPLNLPPSIPTPPKNIYKSLFFTLLGLFIVVVFILAYSLIVFTKTETPPPQKNSEITIVTPTPTPTVVIENTQNWKTYTDPTYKFSINYPSTWTIDTKLSNNKIFSVSSPEKIEDLSNPNRYEGYLGDDFSISFYKNYKTSLTNGKTIEAYLSDKTNFSIFSKTKIGTIDAYSATELGMTEYPTYFIVSNNDIFQIDSNIEFSSLELQILNSFKLN